MPTLLDSAVTLIFKDVSFYELEVSMVDDVWLMRVEDGLAAHFKEEGGSSRPGVQWAIGLKRGEEIYRVRVKALLADDASCIGNPLTSEV